jgi:hypothetical protein
MNGAFFATVQIKQKCMPSLAKKEDISVVDI